MLVLAINSGSSSLKCAVIDPGSGETVFAALVERLGSDGAVLRVTVPRAPEPRAVPGVDHTAALEVVLEEVRSRADVWSKLSAVGHRVVHGGELFSASVRIDEHVLRAIEDCVPLAPLHNRANLLGIEAAKRALSQLPHVAVFDTAFHQTMDETAYRYAVPAAWYKQHHIRRYGFHGTSHRFVAEGAAELLQKPLGDLNLITAHLGNGSSVTAIRGGRSVDTSMGFTPLEGLVMGTRSGDLDPAIPFHLQKAGLGFGEIERALNHESGLLGLSELGSDMRTLSERYHDHEGARLAVEVFCHRLAKYVGALATHFERLDALIFTGGIGEHSVLVRSKVVARLSVLGLLLDERKNEAHDPFISAPESRASVLVVPTNEELLIARDVLSLVGSS